jgi:hypothetical protein
MPRITQTGEKGPEVIAWQLYLMAKGYMLPRFGADGDHGSETEAATQQFLADQEAAGVDTAALPGGTMAAEDNTMLYLGIAGGVVLLVGALVWIGTQAGK